MLDKKISTETRRKMSKAKLGRKRKPFTKEHLNNMMKARRKRDKGKSWYKKCLECGNNFKVYRHRPDAKFCSNSCRGKYHYKKGINRPPLRTGQIPWNKGESKKTDIRLLRMAEGRTGEKNWMWKGGRMYNQNGYVLILNRNHPKGVTRGYVFEHVLVVEKFLGRYLKKGEIVHHKNMIRDDNRIENLVVMENIEHLRMHRQMKRNKIN